MATLESVSNCVVTGNIGAVTGEVQALIDGGTEPSAIINDGLIAGMNIVGPKFKAGEMFVPEVLMAAKAMAAGVDLVKPLLSGDDMPSLGKVVLGTVKGDLHDIGKNLVGMMLESTGFEVVNVGIDVAPEKFLEAAKESGAKIVAMSALLTTTMLAMKETVDLFKENGMDTKLIVGGAPVSKEFADEIGAAGFAPDAATACDLCKELLA
ncbi:MAG: corrinoid protein [Bacillota bacterium]|jgi:5-methyltetrahydrofolate--homocysteine methyltransferase